MDKACKFDAISLEIAGLPVGRNAGVRRRPGTKQSNAVM